MNHVLLSIPISILMIYLITIGTEYFTEELIYNDKVQKGFIINFVIGMLLLFFSHILFSKKKILENDTMKYSTIITGLYLTIIAVLLNWNELDSSTKIILMAMTIIVLIFYSYQIDNINKNTILINTNENNLIDNNLDYNLDNNLEDITLEDS